MNGTLLVTRWLLIRRNKGKTDATAVPVAENASPEDIGHSGAFLDMTDVENPEFRVSAFCYSVWLIADGCSTYTSFVFRTCAIVGWIQVYHIRVVFNFKFHDPVTLFVEVK